MAKEGFLLGAAVLKIYGQANLVRPEDKFGNAATIDSKGGNRPNASLNLSCTRDIAIRVDSNRLGKLRCIARDVKGEGNRCDVIDS